MHVLRRIIAGAFAIVGVGMLIMPLLLTEPNTSVLVPLLIAATGIVALILSPSSCCVGGR